MNWLVTLLHVIRGEEIGYTGKLVEKTIFESKHWGWPDNSCFGKDRTDNGLSSGLELFVNVTQAYVQFRKSPWFYRIRMWSSHLHCRTRHGQIDQRRILLRHLQFSPRLRRGRPPNQSSYK